MKTEYEAIFENADKEDIQNRLRNTGAVLEAPEFLQKRKLFFLPDGRENAWLRVRNGNEKDTLTLKIVEGDSVDDLKEIDLDISNYDEAIEMLEIIGCTNKAYQETKREIWKLDLVEITIDEWPFLEPLVGVEGASEEEVGKACEKLGLDYNKALFCSVAELYTRKYRIRSEEVAEKMQKLTFEMENPFEI